MKKILAVWLTVLFLGSVPGPIFAAEGTPVPSPTAKVKKHKKAGHHRVKKSKKSKTTAEGAKIPAAK